MPWLSGSMRAHGSIGDKPLCIDIDRNRSFVLPRKEKPGDERRLRAECTARHFRFEHQLVHTSVYTPCAVAMQAPYSPPSGAGTQRPVGTEPPGKTAMSTPIFFINYQSGKKKSPSDHRKQTGCPTLCS